MLLPTTFFSLSTGQRQAVFYALMLIGTGASLPYMPLWFAARGMTGAQIGLILALPLLLRAVTGPIIGVWADRFALYRTPLILMAAAGSALYALLLPAALFTEARLVLFAVVWTVSFTFMTSLGALADAMTMELARREGFDYSVPRAVGSAAFIAANIAVGYILKWLGVDTVLIWMIAVGALTAWTARFVLPPVPRLETAALPEAGWVRLRRLAASHDFLWLMIALGCIQAAHAFYYGFSSLIWKRQGLGGDMIGYLWAMGVVAEVLMLAFGLRMRRRFGVWNLLIGSGVLSVVRWGAMALLPPVWMLWPLQMLHAASFAACYLAGLELTRRFAPAGYESLAQSVSAAYVVGVMMGLATLASGPIYDVLGPRGYGVMAGFAAAGLCVSVWLYLRRGQEGEGGDSTQDPSPSLRALAAMALARPRT